MRAVSILAVLIVMSVVICDVGLAQQVVSVKKIANINGVFCLRSSGKPFTGKVVCPRSGKIWDVIEIRDGNAMMFETLDEELVLLRYGRGVMSK